LQVAICNEKLEDFGLPQEVRSDDSDGVWGTWWGMTNLTFYANNRFC
jgi:hypothetical protein